MPRARLRDLGITTGTLPTGRWNAITDVPGVRVGYTTLIHDQPSIIRTGVTAIWPRGPEIWTDAAFAGIHSFNGNGEMADWAWIAEQVMLAPPICITNTHSVGVVRDAVCAYAVREKVPMPWLLPVVAETYDMAAGSAMRRASRCRWYWRQQQRRHFPGVRQGQPCAPGRGDQRAADAVARRHDPVFQAAAEATQEAILNTLAAAETMAGLALAGHTAHVRPLDRLVAVMKRSRPWLDQ